MLWGIGSDPRTLLSSDMMRPAGGHLVLERNPPLGVWNVDGDDRPLPNLDGLRYRIVFDEVALNLFLAGELDELAVLLTSAARGELDATVLEAVFPGPGTSFLVFSGNRASAPVKESWARDARFRTAVARPIDREALIELVYRGAAVPLVSSVNPTFGPWVHSNLPVPGFDPAVALTLLANLGFDRCVEARYLMNAGGRRARFRITLVAENVTGVQRVAVLADPMRGVGLEVTTSPLSCADLVEQLSVIGDDRPSEVVCIGLTAPNRTWLLNMALAGGAGAFHAHNRSGGRLDAFDARVEQLANEGRRPLDDVAVQRPRDPGAPGAARRDAKESRA